MVAWTIIAAGREMERSNGLGICFEGSLTRLADKCDGWSERKRGNSGNSQTLDVRKSTDGPSPKMGTTRGTAGLDSKLKSPLWAVEFEMFLWKCRVGSCVTKTGGSQRT